MNIKIIEVYIDGACEPINPGGTASYGLVVYKDKKRVFAKGMVIGSGATMGNNVAEYSGLVAFLTLYLRNPDRQPALVMSDSQLVVNQMTGQWRVNGGLYYPYYQKAKELLGKEIVEFQWIPREQNVEADQLSMAALEKIGVHRRVR